MMMMRRCALVLLVLQAGRTSCDSPDVSTGMGLPARLRGGAGARSRETRQEMNQRWRREARERAERQAAEEAAEERASAAGRVLPTADRGPARLGEHVARLARALGLGPDLRTRPPIATRLFGIAMVSKQS